MDFAGLDTERMEMKSLLDDNFRRFSKRFTYLESKQLHEATKGIKTSEGNHRNIR